MTTGGEFRDEAQHLRDLAIGVTDDRVLKAIEKLIGELESRARELQNGA